MIPAKPDPVPSATLPISKTHALTALPALVVAILALFLGAAASRKMPRHIDVGTHRLRVSDQGSGRPAVILDSFGPASIETWNRIQPEIARFTRVIAYDHAGYGASEPGPLPRDATRIAHELRDLLRRLDVPPPYLLVGYSFGGPYIRVFASLYPDKVAGLIFVDPTQESFMSWLNVTYPEMNVVTDEHRAKQTEWGMQWDSLNQAHAARLPNVPITLISGAATHDVFTRKYLPLWVDAHAAWLRSAPNATHLITTNSGHGVVHTEPHLIVNAVRSMLAAPQGRRAR